MSAARKSPARLAYELAYRLERLEYQPDTAQSVIDACSRELSRCVGKGAREGRVLAAVSFETKHYIDMLLCSRRWIVVETSIYRTRSRVRRLPASRLPGVSPERIRTRAIGYHKYFSGYWR